MVTEISVTHRPTDQTNRLSMRLKDAKDDEILNGSGSLLPGIPIF